MGKGRGRGEAWGRELKRKLGYREVQRQGKGKGKAGKGEGRGRGMGKGEAGNGLGESQLGREEREWTRTAQRSYAFISFFLMNYGRPQQELA